ncbi:MAG: T9SS type A sorting domain-containing protein [Candidatus Kapaibacterium sp.]
MRYFIIQTSRLEELSIEIYDIMSKLVFESTFNKVRSGKVISINSTDMKSGNYFYRIVYKNEVISSNVLTIVK